MTVNCCGRVMLFGVTRQLALSVFKYTKYYILDILTENPFNLYELYICSTKIRKIPI